MAKVAVEKGYNLKSKDNNFPERTLVDFTNPQAKQ
jgi:hypothetical protein